MNILFAIMIIIIIIVVLLLNADIEINLIILLLIIPLLVFMYISYISSKSKNNVYGGNTSEFGKDQNLNNKNNDEQQNNFIISPFFIDDNNTNNNNQNYVGNKITHDDINNNDKDNNNGNDNNDNNINKNINKNINNSVTNESIMNESIKNESIMNNDEKSINEKIISGINNMTEKELVLLMTITHNICTKNSKKINNYILFEGIKKDDIPHIIKLFLDKTKTTIDVMLEKINMELYLTTNPKSYKYIIKYKNKQLVDKEILDLLMNILYEKFDKINLNYGNKCKEIINECFNIIKLELTKKKNNIQYIQNKVIYKPYNEYTWSIILPTSIDNKIILQYPNIEDNVICEEINNKWYKIRSNIIDKYNFKFDYLCRLVVLLHEFIHLLQFKGLEYEDFKDGQILIQKSKDNKKEIEASIMNYVFLCDNKILDILHMNNIYQCLLFNFSLVKCLHSIIGENITSILNKWASTLGIYTDEMIDNIVVHIEDKRSNTYIKNRLAFDYYDIEMCVENPNKFRKYYWDLFTKNIIIGNIDNNIMNNLYKKYKFEKYWN